MPLASFVGPDHLGGEVAGNGISKLVFAIISAVAEAERDRIVQRSLDVKSDQRRRGRHLGGKRDATAAEANAATAQVRGLLEILDGEAAAMAVEMIAAGNSPACLRSTRSDKAARTFASCKPFASRSTAVAGSKSAIRCFSRAA